MLEQVKTALRITTDAFNDELNNLIEAARLDLGIAGIPNYNDPLVSRAIVMFCKLNFGELETGVYDRLKRAYDEQKAQMQSSSMYGLGGCNGQV